MNKFLTFIVIILILSATIIGIVKPKMYSPIVFGVTDIEVQQAELPTVEATVTANNIEQTQVSKPITSANIEQTLTSAPVTVSTSKTVKTPPSTKAKTTATPTTKIAKTTPKEKTLSDEEEIIQWNKWRSDLQNRIMQDAKINAPVGTAFRYTFRVDSDGVIHNLNVWCENPVYTNSAIRDLKPQIKAYERTAILNFPRRTNREVIDFKGGFRVANSERFSTPSDFTDVEKIKVIK